MMPEFRSPNQTPPQTAAEIAAGGPPLAPEPGPRLRARVEALEARVAVLEAWIANFEKPTPETPAIEPARPL